MAGMSPTVLTRRRLRRLNILNQIVEKWNPFARIRQDLFGTVDLLAVSAGITYGIQITSLSNVSARKKKMVAAPATAELLEAGWRMQVEGWKKNKSNRWESRIWELNANKEWIEL